MLKLSKEFSQAIQQATKEISTEKSKEVVRLIQKINNLVEFLILEHSKIETVTSKFEKNEDLAKFLNEMRTKRFFNLGISAKKLLISARSYLPHEKQVETFFKISTDILAKLEEVKKKIEEVNHLN